MKDNQLEKISFRKHHPIQMIKYINEDNESDDIQYFLKQYKYDYNETTKQCTHTEELVLVTPKKVRKTFIELSSDIKSDVALASMVIVNGEIRHIPMIDFAGHLKIDKDVITILKHSNVISKYPSTTQYIYNSGHSLHLYGTQFLSLLDWIEFMNALKDMRIVDQMWIKHSLNRGHAALRWSCNNTKRYTMVPKLLGTFSQLRKQYFKLSEEGISTSENIEDSLD